MEGGETHEISRFQPCRPDGASLTCNEAETHSENLDSISKHDNGKEPAARSGIRAVLRPWGAAVSNGLNVGKHDMRAAQAEVVKENAKIQSVNCCYTPRI